MTARGTVLTFYQLLSLESSASADDIKKAFRAEIARYHPDKVQHLGKEFQEIAATRAAQLTEAYRTLMNPEMRSQYDRAHNGNGTAPAATVHANAPAAAPAYEPPARPATPPPAGRGTDAAGMPQARFAQEHASRDEVVKKATLGRIRQVVGEELGSVTELAARGFDFHCTVKSKKLFGRGGEQRIAVRVVAAVDRTAVQDTWGFAQRAGGELCVLLMGSGMAAAGELSNAIGDMRRKSRSEGVISIIPVDLRDWSAHVPEDAPPVCRNILARLREPSR